MAIKTGNSRRTSAAEQGAWKGKTPLERRRLSKKVAPTDDKIGFATVSVKLRPVEKEAFKNTCDELGLTPNKAMRIMARHTAGFLELSNRSADNLELVTKQIIGVSRNINQIAKAANRTGSPDYIAFMEDREELGKELRQLQRVLQNITNVTRRRSDGLTTLKEASKQP
ncbi:DNA mobilization endonuclease VirD1/MobC family subunit [Ahrensia marina]|uniref:Uncharacterized protein n=1 Tax=Ahrensia marina TaxID=1514904 RepID=A0A0N0E723_9HYPH|nr:DNA mobilization endonuclease VirD1/MobC family subunit [Ahrensia marina]KPB00688.1 hypothetical protein SU32_12805 [Ahrensia marina]